MHNQLFEGLEKGDLKRLIHPKLHIDEFRSKMGNDADIIVLSFKVDGKEPAKDLMSFTERGYEWVLDSDISSGELDDGEYLVFIELARTPEAAEQIFNLIEDILNLTDQDLSDWKFQYRKSSKEHDITADALANIIPLTPNAYISKFGEKDIDAMMEAARIPMRQRQAPVNDWTESLRVAAGLK